MVNGKLWETSHVHIDEIPSASRSIWQELIDEVKQELSALDGDVAAVKSFSDLKLGKSAFGALKREFSNGKSPRPCIVTCRIKDERCHIYIHPADGESPRRRGKGRKDKALEDVPTIVNNNGRLELENV